MDKQHQVGSSTGGGAIAQTAQSLQAPFDQLMQRYPQLERHIRPEGRELFTQIGIDLTALHGQATEAFGWSSTTTRANAETNLGTKAPAGANSS